MVERGDLTLQFQLLCPDDGAVLARFDQDDPLPIGQEVAAGDCDPFVVEKRHLWVAYVPTTRLLSGLLKEARGGKAPARRPGLRRRALPAWGIDSIKHRLFNRSTTST